ncbi:Transient receptor potential channel pyrexia [Gryllus bimaculatus]|nr:Transient receptor potential channel pyrexia [Gryllus bimaculatus]
MSWLAVLHFTNVVSAINYKFAMFQYIMRKLVDHLLVFAFILTGFSVAFFLLYGGDPEARFRTLWEASLSTTLMLLQGDLTGTPLFRGSAGPGDDPPVLPPDILVAGGLMQQLFVVIAVLALLNMWVGLAVRGGRELERQGHIHYSRNQVRTLAVLDRLLGWAQAVFGCAPAAAAAAPLTGPRALSDAERAPTCFRRPARRRAPATPGAPAARASAHTRAAATARLLLVVLGRRPLRARRTTRRRGPRGGSVARLRRRAQTRPPGWTAAGDGAAPPADAQMRHWHVDLGPQLPACSIFGKSPDAFKVIKKRLNEWRGSYYCKNSDVFRKIAH